MPKKPTPDKKTRARIPDTKPAFRQTPSSINDLLVRRPALTALAGHIPVQQHWVAWLRDALSEELRGHIVNVVARDLPGPRLRRELVVLADSAAWCERLRYAVAELSAAITAKDAAVQHTRVRVSPGGAPG